MENLQKPGELTDGQLKGFMKKVGIPSEKFDLYKQVVLWEQGRKRMRDYATLFDFSSPDYQRSVEQQNSRILEIRQAMKETKNGRSTISQMRRDGIGDESTIPIAVIK